MIATSRTRALRSTGYGTCTRQTRRETLNAVRRDAPGRDAWWPGAVTGLARLPLRGAEAASRGRLRRG